MTQQREHLDGMSLDFFFASASNVSLISPFLMGRLSLRWKNSNLRLCRLVGVISEWITVCVFIFMSFPYVYRWFHSKIDRRLKNEIKTKVFWQFFHLTDESWMNLNVSDNFLSIQAFQTAVFLLLDFYKAFDTDIISSKYIMEMSSICPIYISLSNQLVQGTAA